MTQQKLSLAAKDIATASYTLAGTSTVSTPTTTAGARGGDLDRDMIAWFDPDPKDPGTFVLIQRGA